MKGFCRCRHRQLPVLHALDRYQRVGHLLDIRSLAFYHQHFKTMIVVEMDMHSGQNLPRVGMLNVRQLPGQVPHMMVIHKRDGADGFLILIPLISDQIVPN